MKKVTTIICCFFLMVCGVSLVFHDLGLPGNKTAMAAPALEPLAWSNVKNNTLPLDLRLSSDDRLSHESPIKDSVNIRDSVIYVYKTKWKTRYKNEADRTAARKAGQHLAAVNPDSLPENLAINSTLVREEQPSEIVDTTKVSSIQLIIDGETVYSKNDNHSVGEGQ